MLIVDGCLLAGHTAEVGVRTACPECGGGGELFPILRINGHTFARTDLPGRRCETCAGSGSLTHWVSLADFRELLQGAQET